jgi:UDP-glucuronate 4-epimerase
MEENDGEASQELGREAKKNLLPMQAGDVEATYADIEALTESVDFRPRVPIEEGIRKFVDWYKSFYEIR